MKVLLTLIALAVAAYAYSDLGARQARTAIAAILGLEPTSVKIKKIIPGYSGQLVEAELAVTFRLNEQAGKWQVAEVRLQDGSWEELELISTAIQNEKIRRTEHRLEVLCKALESYRKEHGYYPRATNITELTDRLTKFLDRLYQNDLWQRPLSYTRTATGYQIASAGPDGKYGTNDDIKVER
ncbi:MAG: type II secretion system protein GspG [Acidobacteriota bacterium]|nr:type II secretion system protein GspG [Blastocatellia bacterium]MDW8412738.1 type II secretion system protein GspG [Acidobacteriota bacterium]